MQTRLETELKIKRKMKMEEQDEEKVQNEIYNVSIFLETEDQKKTKNEK